MKNRMRYAGGQYYVKSEQEMIELFPYARQALENTQKDLQIDVMWRLNLE